MNVTRFTCRHCRRLLTVKKPDQKYCGRKACQAARKRKWSRKKYAEDPDYRLNQKESTYTWLEAQGGAAEYHRKYRKKKRRAKELEAATESVVDECNSPPEAEVEVGGESHCEWKNPDDESRFAQVASGFDSSANSDVCFPDNPIKTGVYRIFSANANRDSVLAEIRVISHE